MAQYRVLVREVHVLAFEVEALDMKDALERVKEGEGQSDGAAEYQSTEPVDTWVVEKYDAKGECIDWAEAEFVLNGKHKEKAV